MIRYRMSYDTRANGRIELFNLGWSAMTQILLVQSGSLGSNNFLICRQPHEYSQHEIDLLRSPR